MIHCVGDSHSSVFSGKDEMQPIWPERSDDKLSFFKSYRIGPATAYQLENKIPIIDEILKQLNSQDSLLFCFGEVDIRAHLKKQMDLQGKTIKDVVRECVDRYVHVLLHYKNRGLNVIAWGPIASFHDDKPYTSGPSFGTGQERNLITKEFNKYLEQRCNENDIKFVTIFDKMVDENLSTKHVYLDDWEACHIHLNQKSMPLILEAFKEKELI